LAATAQTIILVFLCAASSVIAANRIEKKGDVKWELYNLTADRTESRDLAASESERAARMKGELEAWLRSVVASLNGADYKAK